MLLISNSQFVRISNVECLCVGGCCFTDRDKSFCQQIRKLFMFQMCIVCASVAAVTDKGFCQRSLGGAALLLLPGMACTLPMHNFVVDRQMGVQETYDVLALCMSDRHKHRFFYDGISFDEVDCV